ncbi:MAG: hypothetical protein AAF657_02060 [Acidobacteriota bacterium]
MMRRVPLGLVLMSLALLSQAAVAAGKKDAAANYGCDGPGWRKGEDMTGPTQIDSLMDVSSRSLRIWNRVGPITFTVMVGCDGKVYDLELNKDDVPKRLETELRRMLGKWRFMPAHVDGTPVASPYNLTLNPWTIGGVAGPAPARRAKVDEAPRPGADGPGTESADEYGCRPRAKSGNQPIVHPKRLDASRQVLSHRELKQWGPIEISGSIGCDGRMHDLAINKDLPEKLDAKLRQQVDAWRFEPATIAGEPFKVKYSLTLGRPVG